MPVKILFNEIDENRPHLDRALPNLQLAKYCTTMKNMDSWAMVCGYEGGGKSNFSCALAEAYLGIPPFAHRLEPDVPLTLNKENWVFTAEDMLTRPYELPRGGVLIADEGATTMLADDTITKEGKEVKKLITVLRERNLFVIICVPEWDLVQPYIRARRTQMLYRCVSRGTVLAYSKPLIQRIRKDEKSKQLVYPPPAFKDHWQERKGELWAAYDKMKNDYLASRRVPKALRQLHNKEVTQLLHISTGTLATWCRAGRIPYELDFLGRRTFKLEDIQAVAAERGVTFDV
jgi:hypothetical protein